MPTGDPGRRRRRAGGLCLLLALALAAAGCEVIKDPEIRVDLAPSKNPVSPGESVQITATVTEDGTPLSAQTLTFSASPVGGFPNGDSAITDLLGQAALLFRVEVDEVSADTTVAVTATVTRGEQTVTGMLDVMVDVTAGGGDR